MKHIEKPIRRWRNIATAVVLYRLDYEGGDCRYQLECLGHGEFSREYEEAEFEEVHAAMLEPEQWCRGCIEGWAVDEEAIESDNS